MDYAQSTGKDISPAKAFDIFEEAKASGLIAPDNISNISDQNVTGGVGFTSPGSTTLSPELLDFLNKKLSSN